MAADNDGMQDRVADYNGVGQERVANNNGIRHKAMATRQQSCEERKKPSLCKKIFSLMRSVRFFFLLPKQSMLRFWFTSHIEWTE